VRERTDYLVVGLGAVGSVVAVALARAGAGVAAVTRGRRGCRRETIRVEGLGEAELLVCGWSEAARRLRPWAAVYAVKAYQLPAALGEAARRGLLGRAGVALQNGLGSLELLEEAYGRDAAVQGLAYFGATRLGGGVRLAAPGRLVLGCRRPPCSPAAERLAADLSGPVRGEYVGWVEPHRWLKLAVNAAVNPVTVLAWAPNRVVAEDPWARRLATVLAEEVEAVARLAGIPLPEDPVEAALRVARATGDNCSSMLQDAAAGRETEVAYINGAVAAEARRRGSRAPVNEAVEAAVRLTAASLAGRPLPCGPA
jgi:2-dehydropantoate 2-reductase